VKRIIFVRAFRRETGGNAKVRDYFQHAAAHPQLDAYVWFTPDSAPREGTLWEAVPPDRVVVDADLRAYDYVFVNGKDWRLIPPGETRVIHLVQHLGYADDAELRGYLRRRAIRFCTSRAAYDAASPFANGPLHFVPAAIDDALFEPGPSRDAGSVTIWGWKDPAFAGQLADALRSEGVAPSMLSERWRPRGEILDALATTDVLVAIPNASEGLFLPPLEAMARGCVVVCSDAIGNREYCSDGETVLQPPRGDVAAHSAAVLRLLRDDALRERLRARGQVYAQTRRMADERRAVQRALSQTLG